MWGGLAGAASFAGGEVAEGRLFESRDELGRAQGSAGVGALAECCEIGV